MPVQDSEPGTAAAPIALDLPCLSCGYNLRGLSGDPVRCPECGYLNPVGELYVPPELIARRVRRAETPLAVSLGALILASVGICSTAMVAVEFANLAVFLEAVPCTASPTALGVLLWYVCRLAFRAACGAQPGWKAAFWQYQRAGVLSLLLVVGPVGVSFLLFLGNINRRAPAEDDCVAFAVFATCETIVLLFGVIPLLRPMHRKLVARLEPLVRDEAIRRAREDLDSQRRLAAAAALRFSRE